MTAFDPGPGWREHLGGMITDPNIVYCDGAIWRCWVRDEPAPQPDKDRA